MTDRTTGKLLPSHVLKILRAEYKLVDGLPKQLGYDSLPVSARLPACPICRNSNGQPTVSCSLLTLSVHASRAYKEVHSHAEKSVGGFFLSPEPEVT
jgi:hypothetical protein